MTDQIIFYHIWRDYTTMDARLWFDPNIPIKIIVEVLPDNKVIVELPHLHWQTFTEFQKEKDLCSQKVYIELPSLYHVPVLGEVFHNNVKIPPNYGIMIPVFDFDWVYFTRSDDNHQNIIRFSEKEIYLENRMSDKNQWLQQHIQPSWNLLNDHQNILTLFQKRVFLGFSKILNQWRTVQEITSSCEWSSAIVGYDLAEVNYQQSNLTFKEKQEQFVQELEPHIAWIESYWELLNQLSQTSTTSLPPSIHLWKKYKNQETFPEWCQEMPLYRWVRRTIVDSHVLYEKEMLLLGRSPDYKNFEIQYLFSKILTLDATSTHQEFTQYNTQNPLKLMGLSGGENGILLSSQNDPDYVPSSAGLVVCPTNPQWYVVNVRKVNYRIMPNGSYVTMKNGHINPVYNGISKNEFYFMDRQTLKPVSPIRPLTEDIRGNREEEIAIVGLEDVRLVLGSDKHDIFFYGVTKSYSYSDAIRIIVGKYNVEKALFYDARVLHPPYEENMCEKNWTWCGNHQFIYRWHPIEIGMVDSSNNRLVINERIPSPAYFKEFRGSSPAVVWKGYHFFSVHSIAQGDNGRKYLHSIVILDLDKKQVVAVSPPFCFEKIQIEYNIGMDIDNGKILFLYSTQDSSSKYIRIPLFHLLETLVFLHQETEFKTTILQNIF